ncbi:hypothetical protein [Singulisphaera sp. PoT]|uniref:hypothetical protein n=1 Tax=Singulisphaera sp. PoT TaxID=3411797 RepID=UPI003BF577DF
MSKDKGSTVRPLRRLAQIAALSAVTLCVLAIANPLLAGPKKPMMKRNDTGLCKLILTLPAKKFQTGKPITFSLDFENISFEPLMIWKTHRWENYMVFVTDTKGKEPPLTEYGQDARKGFKSGNRDHNIRWFVQPGDTRSIVRDLDFSKNYKLEPGKYRVHVLYDEILEPQIRILSNRVSFEVK